LNSLELEFIASTHTAMSTLARVLAFSRRYSLS
jgi:hypothetical protein